MDKMKKALEEMDMEVICISLWIIIIFFSSHVLRRVRVAAAVEKWSGTRDRCIDKKQTQE